MGNINIKDVVFKALTENEAFIFDSSRIYHSAGGFPLPFFIDPRRICANPKYLKQIAQYFAELMKENNIDVIAGCETGGIAVAEAVSLETNLPFFYIRKAPQDHGMESVIGGKPPKEKSQRVAIFDDSIGAGGSMRKFTENVKSEGYNPVMYLCPLEMNLFSEAGKRKAEMSQLGIELIAIATCDEWIEYLFKQGELSPDFKDICKKFIANPLYFNEKENMDDYKNKLDKGSIWYK